MNERRPIFVNGFIGLILILAVASLGVLLFINGASNIDAQLPGYLGSPVADLIVGALIVSIAVAAFSGMVIVQPNQSRSIILFGRYMGTIRKSGWWWTVPLTNKPNVSLRVRNFNSDRLKVNDIRGNPIEIGAVVVWRVVDAAKALFEVEKYEEFVTIQSETALRHIASLYPYDSPDDETPSLRGETDAISRGLATELQSRLAVAGVEVVDTRLTHLAYAPEIAGAMLQRQQAEAVVAARAKIVEGAVGMVQMAIEQLQLADVIDLDDERRATMINNLMVAIVSERSAQPVLNAGTLY